MKKNLAAVALTVAFPLLAQTTLTVKTQKALYGVNPEMYGIFFEDINFGADGGLYAEMVKNRSFEFPQHLMGWNTFGKVSVQSQGGSFERNPHYVRLEAPGHSAKYTGLENEGFRGMGLRAGAGYRFSVYARGASTQEQRLLIQLIDDANTIIGEQKVTVNGTDWKKYTAEITPRSNAQKGRLRLFLDAGTSLDLEHISLFPADTWKGRENGLRSDLAQALADLHPGVFRFPGGCIVEGTDLATRYNWKLSVGPVENRPLNENRWNYTFKDKLFPDYFQSYGMGFFELFQLSEDIGATPLPVLSCGLACQFQNTDPSAHCAVEDLQPFVQDAIDLVEFANGAVTTPWGKVRAEMGHPAPFHLKYLAVGNEQWGKEYPERLAVFMKALRARCPEIRIVGTAGPSAEGAQFDFLWPEMRKAGVDLVDEHYYKSPDWFFGNAKRYDAYPRTGPKVFAGEYAAHDAPAHQANTFLAALSEAAFMTGLERNADVVRLATYAPLFAHVDAWQWRPDLIWFDNTRVTLTPNYRVQQLYGQYKGSEVLSTFSEGQPLAGKNGLYASAVKDAQTRAVVLKVVNREAVAQSLKVVLDGYTANASTLEVVRLQQDNLGATNEMGQPDRFVPERSSERVEGNTLQLELPKQSFSIFVLQPQPKTATR
jgi:alpha-L-arabinofuranosidase